MAEGKRAINKDNYCVIMAGGIGSRFWPMSRESFPKQFHDILGTGRTLIQQTFDRFVQLCPKENILIVTNKQYKDLVLKQLKGIDEKQVLCEPSRRNTAPCIAYAAYRIKKTNPDAAMVVAPSDHLILKEEEFLDTIEIALEKARSGNYLMTLGIKPSRPDTGYGYIQFKEEGKNDHKKVRKVKTFTEKPSHDMAMKFIKSGDFYWNSGIFIWTVESILTAFDKHLHEMNELFLEGEKFFGTRSENKFIRQTYEVCTNISIDYGIMEKARNAYVVLSNFGWSDLGTWGSLYTHLDHDKKGNAVVGDNVVLYNSLKNVVHAPKDKLVVLQGLNGYIVVESDNVLLVCKKSEEQKIKEFVSDLQHSKDNRYL